MQLIFSSISRFIESPKLVSARYVVHQFWVIIKQVRFFLGFILFWAWFGSRFGLTLIMISIIMKIGLFNVLNKIQEPSDLRWSRSQPGREVRKALTLKITAAMLKNLIFFNIFSIWITWEHDSLLSAEQNFNYSRFVGLFEFSKPNSLRI